MHLFPHKKNKKGDTARLAAQLAPLEEQNARAAQRQGANGHVANNGGLIQEHGALIVDSDHLNVPKGLDGKSGDGTKNFLGIEPVVLVILIAALAFTAFIAWQISLMPRAD